MTGMPFGLRYICPHPIANPVLVLCLRFTQNLASAARGSTGRLSLGGLLISFLREYAGPIAIILPLAFALMITAGIRSTPTRDSAPQPAQASPQIVQPVADVSLDTPMAMAGPRGRGTLPLAPPLVHEDESAAGNEQATTDEKRKAAFTYTVDSGDTIGAIADRFGITIDTILSANRISDPRSLQIGTDLTILPVSGVVHTISSRDTLDEIAALYDVSSDSIAKYNGLANDEPLKIGAELVVPDGKIRLARANVSNRGGTRPTEATGALQWSTTGGISTYFSSAHRGIDIMSSMGVPVYAADGGTVVSAIRGTADYGDYLVIDHGNGLRTLYAHLSAFYVEYGEKVAKGDRVGAVGMTGISTGPHLHFEVWKNGAKVDPLDYLP